MKPVRLAVLLCTLSAALAGCGEGQPPEPQLATDEATQALAVCDGVTCGGHGVCRDNAGSAAEVLAGRAAEGPGVALRHFGRGHEREGGRCAGRGSGQRRRRRPSR